MTLHFRKESGYRLVTLLHRPGEGVIPLRFPTDFPLHQREEQFRLVVVIKAPDEGDVVVLVLGRDDPDALSGLRDSVAGNGLIGIHQPDVVRGRTPVIIEPGIPRQDHVVGVQHLSLFLVHFFHPPFFF